MSRRSPIYEAECSVCEADSRPCVSPEEVEAWMDHHAARTSHHSFLRITSEYVHKGLRADALRVLE